MCLPIPPIPLISSILYHIIFILSRGNFAFSLLASAVSQAECFNRCAPLAPLPLDIMYYNISILVCQVLFLEILLTPIMRTNLAISFWM